MFDTGGRAVGLIGTYPHGIDIGLAALAVAQAFKLVLPSWYIYKLSPPMTFKCVAAMSPIHTVSQARKPLDPNAILAVAWQLLGEPSLMV